MARRPRNAAANAKQAQAALNQFQKLPLIGKVIVAVVVLAAAAIYFSQHPIEGFFGQGPGSSSAATEPLPPAGELTVPLPNGVQPVAFTFWNVENFFDDQDDPRRSVDEEYDNAFSRNPALLRLKLERLTTTILRLNNGLGPDILACCEVESVRAVELLRDALNAKLANPAQHYRHISMINLNGGRHFAPCVISRIPIEVNKSRLIGRQIRILETHLTFRQHPLVLLSSHWTSQVSQQGEAADSNTGRGRYAALLAERHQELTASNPQADVLVCGDFNDTPESTVVRDGLGSGSLPLSGSTRLLNLLAGRPADTFGTHFFRAPLIYDQICVSAGMLDSQGWGCQPETISVTTQGMIRSGSTRRQPWRFGNPEPKVADDQRGYSDHFPVSVLLTVAAENPGKP
jgi:endonuclease/exonuclease/phosphatase family metal-dependent hydrolase